jgi:hypothetical protein
MRGRVARGERLLLFAAWVTQLAILILVAAHHEMWRDEADVWLFARDAAFGDWRNFFQHSGSPPLWHLLVKPLARAGLQYASMVWLNVAIVAVGVAIFLRFAPLPLALKLLFPFGVLPLFEYGVVARSYGLSFTLLMAICALLSARRPQPLLLGLLLALLANTNAHSFLLAAGLGLYWLLESLRSRKPGTPLLSRGTLLGMAIAVAGAGFVVLLLWPPDDPQSFERESNKTRVLLSALRDAFFPAFSRFPGGVLGILSLGTILAALRPRREIFALLLACSALLLGFFVAVYGGYLRHAGFLWLAVTAALWFEERGVAFHVPQRARLLMLFAVSAVVAAKAGIDHAGLDIDAPFSGSSDAVAFLRTLDLDGAVVVAHPATTGEALLPDLPIQQLYYPGHDVTGSYLPWNRAYLTGLAKSVDDAMAQTRERFPDRSLVFITTRPMDDPAAWGRTWGLELLHRGPEPPRLFKQEERYSIFTTRDVGGGPTRAE